MRRLALVVFLLCCRKVDGSATADDAAALTVAQPVPNAVLTPLTSVTPDVPPTASVPDPIVPTASATAAASARKPWPIVSATPPTGAIARTVWMERMQTLMPPRVCAAPYFKQCFTVSTGDCEKLVATLSASCMRDAAPTLPPQIDSVNGATYGRSVGTCIGAAYEIRQRRQGHFVNTPECNDVSRWQ
jgi:hypothetical protein